MKYIIGLDLGTTELKAVLFDETGAPVRALSAGAGLFHPAEKYIEQDPADWYEKPCALIRDLTEGFDKSAVAAIGISSQGISVVPADKDNRPLARAICWLDTRAEAELNKLLTVISREKLFEMTGKHPTPQYTLPKLIWLKKHDPEIFERAARFLLPMDYAVARFTGRALTDPTMAGGTLLYDLDKRGWSAELADIAGVPLEKLPEICLAGTSAGHINAETAALTGLSEHTAVAVGAQDQKAAALGAGIEDGVATLSLGTAGALEVLCEHKSRALPTFLFADGKRFVLEGCINTFGAAIKWARDNVFAGLDYREMDELAQKAPMGCGGVRFYPHLSGAGTPHMGQTIRPGWLGMSLSTGRAELIRAIYEGLACEVKLNIDEAVKSGAVINRLKLFGGGSSSDIVCRIISDFCNLEADALDFAEMAALGAAIAAAKCINLPSADTFGAKQNLRHYKPENAGAAGKIYLDYQKGFPNG